MSAIRFGARSEDWDRCKLLVSENLTIASMEIYIWGYSSMRVFYFTFPFFNS